MNKIYVFNNYFSRLLCSVFNIRSITFYNLIFLGCYKDKIAILKLAISHYYQYKNDKLYIFKYLKGLMCIKEGIIYESTNKSKNL